MPTRPNTPPSPGQPGHPPATLARIIEHKRDELERAKAAVPQSELERRAADTARPRNFFKAVTAGPRTAVIAEIKRRSPSAGLIRPEYDGDGFSPERIASRYRENGASAISCLTDGAFFGGDLGFIARIKAATDLPVLRKDFIIDPYQIWESRAAGADAVLLMAECLNESQILDGLILARELNLTALLEVHSVENLLRVRPHVGFPHPGYCLLGINNRDLNTMTVDIAHTLRLADLVEQRSILVSESGISAPEHLRRLSSVGVRIVLVGEHLMRAEDPGAALAALLGR